MFRKTNVAVVLGAGPAGLLAAHAAERKGWEVKVFSAPCAAPDLPRKSELHGCQYLHAYIPGITEDTFEDKVPVHYLLNGTADQYRRKVYGPGWNGTVSVDEFGPEQDHYAWDLRATYDVLWQRWYDRIIPLSVTPRMAEVLAAVKGQRVFSTVPVPSLCLRPDEHKFVTQDVWAMGSALPGHAQLRELPYRAPDNTVQCNGEDAPRWYRAATVFGQSTLEWPMGPRPPVSGVVQVQKPLSTDCDCHTGPRWHRLGRYGKWQKGVLVHTAFEEVMDL